MRHEVTLPALGESVTEGTVTRWLKSVGDTVAVDEPLVEISTDKENLKKNTVFAILGVNVIQQSTKMAREGDYKRAQAVAKAWNNVMTRDATKLSEDQNVQIDAFRQNIGDTYKLVYHQ
jgi:multidrug efflux pump subunit AcrA (membrane-fusion protein)